MSYKIKYVKVVDDKWFRDTSSPKDGKYLPNGYYSFFPLMFIDDYLYALYNTWDSWNIDKKSKYGSHNIFLEVSKEDFLQNTKLEEKELTFVEELLETIMKSYTGDSWLNVPDNNNPSIDKDIETIIITIINNAKLR